MPNLVIGKRTSQLSPLGKGLTNPITYILRDRFDTNRSSGNVIGTNAEPGPGTRAGVDSGARLSIVSGYLVQSAHSATDPRMHFSIGTPWGIGLCFTTYTKAYSGRTRFGFASSSGGVIDFGLAFHVGGLKFYPVINSTGFSNLDIGVLSSSTEYKIMIVLRTSGFFLIGNGGGYVYELLYVTNSGFTTTVYPGCSSVTGGSDIYQDTKEWHLRQLSGSWENANGIATSVLSGSLSVGNTYSHMKDCLIGFTVTTLPSSGQIEICFRRVDANNYWVATINSSGTLDLDEVVSGTPTQRGTASSVITAGERVLIIANNEQIELSDATARRINYSGASNFKTETSGSVVSLGSGGVVSDLIAWPRFILGDALSQLSGG